MADLPQVAVTASAYFLEETWRAIGYAMDEVACSRRLCLGTELAATLPAHRVAITERAG